MSPELLKPHLAIVRFYPKYASVLCPVGHVVTHVDLGPAYAGSSDEAELSAWQAGLPNRFDRLAAQCCQEAKSIAQAIAEEYRNG